MLLTRKSQITGIEHTMDLDITQEQINKFNSGALIQEAFPHLKAADREFVLSGITAEEWDHFMTEPDE